MWRQQSRAWLRENGMTRNLHFDAVELRATREGGRNASGKRGRVLLANVGLNKV